MLLPFPFLAILQIADRNIVYFIAAGFLLSLICIGVVFRRFSADSRDYFCANGQAKWWLVGGSSFMQSFSAWTFTGAASIAYHAGWSVVVMYGAGVVANLVISVAVAPWFRRLRVTTPADAIRLRFGPGMEQFYSCLQLAMGLLFSSTQLLALAIFTSALLGFPVWAVIIALGGVVLCYTVLSGAWAVLAADFVQALVLVPVTILLAVVCLQHIGGWDGLVAAISAAGLDRDFTPVKSLAQVAEMKGISAGYFTIGFFFAWYLNTTVQTGSLVMCGKYLAVKDESEARKAAWLTAALTTVAMAVFFIPPMVARILLPDQIATMQLSLPAEGAYAGIAMHLLPVGLVGLVLVSMCAATMSSLDGGLTGLAAIITQNVYPALCRLFRRQPFTGAAQLRLGRIVNLLCAVAVISIALVLARAGRSGVFSLMLEIIAILFAPITLPMALGLFVRRVAGWVPVFSIVVALAVALAVAFLPDLFGAHPWLFQERIFAVLGAGALAFFGGRAMGGSLTHEAAAREQDFFTRRDRPINFSAEVGAGNDARQMRIMAMFSWMVGAGFWVLVLPDSSTGHAGKFIGLAGVCGVVGALLWWKSTRRSTL